MAARSLIIPKWIYRLSPLEVSESMGNHDSHNSQAAELGSVGFRTELGSWASIRVLWIGSWRTTRRAAMYSLIVTAKMNGVDPQAWLADVLARIASHPAHRLDELLLWNWTSSASTISARAA